MISASLAVAGATGVAAYSVAVAGRAAAAVEILEPAGLILLVAGLMLRWPLTVPWSVLFLGSGYVTARIGHATVDGWAAAVGVALLLVAELAGASIEDDARVHEEPAVVRRRIATLATLAAAALGVNVLLVATAAFATPAGLLLAALGVAAAVGAVGFVLRLARAPSGTREPRTRVVL